MKSRRSCRLMLTVVFCAVASMAGADSITMDGTVHTDVFIRQSESMYYVQLPETGRVVAAFKSDVAPESVRISPDPVHRAALLQQWRDQQTERNPEPAAPRWVAENRRKASRPDDTARLPSRESASVELGPNRPFTGAAGDSPSQRGRDHKRSSTPPPDSVGAVLKAQLRGLGLDYAIRPGGVLFISTPERLQHEAMEPLETRVYELRNLGAEVLPKVVVRNEGGRMGNVGGYGGGNSRGGNSGGAGGRSDNIADIISRGPSAGEVPATAN